MDNEELAAEIVDFIKAKKVNTKTVVEALMSILMATIGKYQGKDGTIGFLKEFMDYVIEKHKKD